jgi:hypothetical protein
MKFWISLITIALAGCTSTSGALKTGPDSYTIRTTASPGAGGGAVAKKAAYDQAAAECAKGGKTLEAGSESSTVPGWNDGVHTVDLSFKCA